jgi:molybdenum cofactor biosynthesis enzyme
VRSPLQHAQRVYLIAGAGAKRVGSFLKERRSRYPALVRNSSLMLSTSSLDLSYRQPRPRLFSSSSHPSPQPQLTHIDPITGRPTMVNVSSKEPTKRVATARGRIIVPPDAFELITGHHLSSSPPDGECSGLEKAKAKARAKGDVLAVAQLAGIMASKRTAELIPLCHPLALSHVSVVLTPCPVPEGSEVPNLGDSEMRGYLMPSVLCEATVSCEGKTGVEMEALTATSVALLTVWDMLKAVAGREMMITDIHVSHKSGGKSGDFNRALVGDD